MRMRSGAAMPPLHYSNPEEHLDSVEPPEIQVKSERRRDGAFFRTAVSTSTSLLIVLGPTVSRRFISYRRMSHAVMLLNLRSAPIVSFRWRQVVCSAATEAFGRVAARNFIHSARDCETVHFAASVGSWFLRRFSRNSCLNSRASGCFRLPVLSS